jgi:ribokinase
MPALAYSLTPPKCEWSTGDGGRAAPPAILSIHAYGCGTKEASAVSATLTVLGSSNTDMVVTVARIPTVGETVLGGDLLIAAGGKGANQAVAAARLGARVRFVGAVGDDDFGRAALDGLRAEGMNIEGVRVVPGAPSGVALIMVDAEGRNIIAVSSGANARVSSNDVRAASEAIQGSGVLLTQLETPLNAVREGLRLARDAGVRTVLNPAPVPQGGLPDRLLGLVDVLTPNEGEASALTGLEGAPEDLAAALVARGVGAVVVTLGERGALVVTPERAESVPAHALDAVDTTAAGDAFNGALSVALAEGRDLFEAARFASAAAGLSVTRRGAQPSMPARDAVERLLAGE